MARYWLLQQLILKIINIYLFIYFFIYLLIIYDTMIIWASGWGLWSLSNLRCNLFFLPSLRECLSVFSLREEKEIILRNEMKILLSQYIKFNKLK